MKGLPDYVDGPLGMFDLDDNGRVEAHLEGGRVTLKVHSTTVRVYDVWVECAGEWCQLSRVDDDLWENPDLPAIPDQVRLWLGRLVAPAVLHLPDTRTERVELEAYVPVVEGAPPLPEERGYNEVPSRLGRWVNRRRDETVIHAVLEEWNLACAASAASGWMPNTPAGEDLLPLFARVAPRTQLEPDDAFSRWLVFEIGRAVKRGVSDRQVLEARRSGVKLVHQALERVVRAVSPSLRFVGSPPPVIGPLDRHQWLVDEGLAARVQNPAHPDAPFRPVFVLRPLLLHGAEVIVEGEVV